MSVRLLVGAALGVLVSSTAFAQSYTAPAGTPAATAPGGLEGRAAGPNLYDGRNVGRAGVLFGDEDGVATTGSIHHRAAPYGAYRLR